MNDENIDSTNLNSNQEMNKIIINDNKGNMENETNIFLAKIKNIQALIKKDSSNIKICK